MLQNGFDDWFWKTICGTPFIPRYGRPLRSSVSTVTGQKSIGTTSGSGNACIKLGLSSRRHAPLRIEWIDESVTVLTFGLQSSDVVALVDDGSLRRWRRFDSRWQEISCTKSIAGTETFRLQQTLGPQRGLHATTQLGYNDAISFGHSSVYYGVGQILQQVVNRIPFRANVLKGCHQRKKLSALPC